MSTIPPVLVWSEYTESNRDLFTGNESYYLYTIPALEFHNGAVPFSAGWKPAILADIRMGQMVPNERLELSLPFGN